MITKTSILVTVKCSTSLSSVTKEQIIKALPKRNFMSEFEAEKLLKRFVEPKIARAILSQRAHIYSKR